ncbi:MAG: hypothetical protein IJ806_07355 [Ruminococcus sp.]|nr:hypothetical protein [Ruminococcus sp.]
MTGPRGEQAGVPKLDFLQFIVVYTLSRLGLFLAVVLLGAFTGKVLIPAVVTFLPYSLVNVKNFFNDPTVSSVIAMTVVCGVLSWVLYDDGRKHTAYDIWGSDNAADSTGVASSLIMVFLIYFIPAIFRDSFHDEGKGRVFYLILYYPCSWAIEKVSNYLTGVVIGSAIMLGTAFFVYVLSFKKYVKSHKAPYLNRHETARKLREAAEEYAEDDEDEDDDF